MVDEVGHADIEVCVKIAAGQRAASLIETRGIVVAEAATCRGAHVRGVLSLGSARSVEASNTKTKRIFR